MNNNIINNLYEFWRHIGSLTGRLNVTQYYSSVSMGSSDWPNRIFDLKGDKSEILEQVHALCMGNKLPDRITAAKPNKININSDFEILFRQKNMAVELNLISNNISENPNIRRVTTDKDSVDFAETASASFGYYVDHNVVYKDDKSSTSARLFVFRRDGECLGCGIIFFDSFKNAGLHMIGTLAKARCCGVGKSMTETLLLEAKENHVDKCVLQASIMGESVYKKLGFKLYGELETYKILKQMLISSGNMPDS